MSVSISALYNEQDVAQSKFLNRVQLVWAMNFPSPGLVDKEPCLPNY